MGIFRGVAQGFVVSCDDAMGKKRVAVRLDPGAAAAGGWAPTCVAGLRTGDKVIVAFEEGDPDYPIVVGRVPNSFG